MSGGIYLMQNGESLIRLDEKPYDAEDVLQALLASHPELLAGEQVDAENPRRWLLVSREMVVPDATGPRWALDHLFLDQDGVPTLVEVKRSSNSQIRREIVGQMLDYAANAVVYWPVEWLIGRFESLCDNRGISTSQQMELSFSVPVQEELFWRKVKENLQRGRIRMVFVADAIPSELQRIVEFLNEQMRPADVLAIEVRQFVGEGLKVLVPHVVGITSRSTTKDPPIEPWNESTFVERLRRNGSAEDAVVAERILQWARQEGLLFQGGRGNRCANLFIGNEDLKPLWMAEGNTSKRLEIWLSVDTITQTRLQSAVLADICNLLNRITGVSVSPQDSSRKIGSCELLQDTASWQTFIDAMRVLFRGLASEGAG